MSLRCASMTRACRRYNPHSNRTRSSLALGKHEQCFHHAMRSSFRRDDRSRSPAPMVRSSKNQIQSSRGFLRRPSRRRPSHRNHESNVARNQAGRFNSSVEHTADYHSADNRFNWDARVSACVCVVLSATFTAGLASKSNQRCKARRKPKRIQRHPKDFEGAPRDQRGVVFDVPLSRSV